MYKKKKKKNAQLHVRISHDLKRRFFAITDDPSYLVRQLITEYVAKADKATHRSGARA